MATERNAPAQSVGPEYRSESEKPTATVSTQVAHDNVHVLAQTPQLIALLTCVALNHYSTIITVVID
jgi:uracil phosphoribosyltransferase